MWDVWEADGRYEQFVDYTETEHFVPGFSFRLARDPLAILDENCGAGAPIISHLTAIIQRLIYTTVIVRAGYRLCSTCGYAGLYSHYVPNKN